MPKRPSASSAKALGQPHTVNPHAITVDKKAAYSKAAAEMKADGELWWRSRLRQVKYLNNILEQDHRQIKRLTGPGLGFGRFWTARRTLAAFEATAMIRRGQFRKIGGGDMRRGAGQHGVAAVGAGSDPRQIGTGSRAAPRSLGQHLFEQSETPAFAQLLVAGCVELLAVDGANEALIETVHPVDLLLPAPVLNRQPYLARGWVLEEAQLVLIDADAFRDAVAADHALCLAVLACQAAQFRSQVKLAKNLKLRSAEQRVGCYLIGLLRGGDSRVPIRLPFEKRRIVWQPGMTRETFSRVLAGLARYGLCVTGDTVKIADLAAAQAQFLLDPLIDDPVTMTPLPVRVP
jgi:CRP/FNR family transcriptional activator FtrB